MPQRKVDLTGQRFGRLTVIGRAPDYVTPSGQRKVRYISTCDCGGVNTALATHLRSGRTRSCGCLSRELAATRMSVRNEDHPGWRGDAIGSYDTMHKRISRVRGKASAYDCADCGRPALQWSYRNSCPDERVGASGSRTLMYCPHVEHYDPRCPSCHKLFDLDSEAAADGQEDLRVV